MHRYIFREDGRITVSIYMKQAGLTKSLDFKRSGFGIVISVQVWISDLLYKFEFFSDCGQVGGAALH